ncbi:unnamed protein product [Leuciscus chuanchicus]
MGGPWVPPHTRSLELQVGVLSEIHPVKAGQEVAVSRNWKVPGAGDGGVRRGPKGPPHAQSLELQLGLTPKIHPFIHKGLLDKTVDISERTGPSGSSFGVTPESRAAGTLPSEVHPFLLGPVSRTVGALEPRARARWRGPLGTLH